jgi:hypothetical protein
VDEIAAAPERTRRQARSGRSTTLTLKAGDRDRPKIGAMAQRHGTIVINSFTAKKLLKPAAFTGEIARSRTSEHSTSTTSSPGKSIAGNKTNFGDKSPFG